MIGQLALAVAVAVVPASLPPHRAQCWAPPVAVPISVGFVRPECEYCSGHRGVEFHPPAGVPVTAVAAGVVTFAGRVARTLYVVVAHGDGTRATYGMLRSGRVGIGDSVMAGQIVGNAAARLYFGLRDVEDRPIDPTGLLGRWVGRPRLVPNDGTTARRARPPTLTCG